MELTQLYYFYVAAQYEHITKASRALRIAQPALTQAIHRLEEELSVPLFDRKGRGIVLNEYGKVVMHHAAEIFARMDQMKAELARLSGNENHTIRLNVLAASRMVTDILIAYKRLRPESAFQLMQNEESQECDICISTIAPFEKVDDSAHRYDIFQEEIYLAVPSGSPYAGRPSISLKEVADADFISLAGSKHLRRICDGYCEAEGFTPNIIFESDSSSTVHDLIAAGLGIGFWPAYSWGAFSKKGLALLPISAPSCKRNLVLTCHTDVSASPLLEDFYQFICRYMKLLQDTGERVPM